MDTSLIIALQTYGFTDKEARVYLTCLELGTSLASTVARRAEVNRGTTYSILQDFKRRWIANEIVKKELKYFSVMKPELLFRREEEKYEHLKSSLPSLLAITERFGNRPKTQFFEGLEGLKKVFEDILLTGKDMTTPYLSFIGTDDMDNRVEEYITKEFAVQRAKLKIKTKAILSMDTSLYMEYYKKNHTVLIIEEPVFDLGNEIVVYGNNKIAILMYDKEEMSWVIIESHTLYNGLTNIFNLIRDAHQKKSIKKKKK